MYIFSTCFVHTWFWSPDELNVLYFSAVDTGIDILRCHSPRHCITVSETLVALHIIKYDFLIDQAFSTATTMASSTQSWLVSCHLHSDVSPPPITHVVSNPHSRHTNNYTQSFLPRTSVLWNSLHAVVNLKQFNLEKKKELEVVHSYRLDYISHFWFMNKIAFKKYLYL